MQITNINETLVVDSRLIAQELGIKHGDWMRNVVAKYQKQAEQAFGQLRFENGTVTNSVGAVNKVRFVYLTEDQSLFFMTLSRNTEIVVECKIQLIKSFSEAKKLLEGRPVRPVINPALTIAQELHTITNLLPNQPRLLQLLTDVTLNHHLEGQYVLPGRPLRGLTEIATEMGFPINHSNRGQLGKYIVSLEVFQPVKEDRLVNGMMLPVNCYEDTPELREAITNFFTH